MSELLWLILPTAGWLGGPGPFSAGVRLETVRGDDHPERVFMVDEANAANRAELDPEHGWIPRRMEIGPGEVITVTRFEREDGRWLPAEGVSETKLPDGAMHRTGFRATRLNVNVTIDPARFRVDKLHLKTADPSGRR